MRKLEVVLGIMTQGDQTMGNSAPIGMVRLYEGVRTRALLRQDRMFEGFRNEYIAICGALDELGIIPVITCSGVHGKLKEDWEGVWAEILDLGDVNPQLTSFPRDLAVQFACGAFLVNDEEKRLFVKCAKPSALGEGGRVLSRQDTIVTLGGEHTDGFAASLAAIRKLKQRVVLLPPALLTRTDVDATLGLQAVAFDNHIDRTCGLLEDASGGLHLLVDERQQTGLCLAGGGIRDLLASETLALYEEACADAGIQLHPIRTSVPGACNFVQFMDGRVIITGGDDALRSLVSDLVGRERVVATKVPIEYYPAFCKAGIRCLINELPTRFLNNWR